MSAKVKEDAVRAGGKIRPMRVGMNALCTVQELTGRDLASGDVLVGLVGLRALVFAALADGARKHKQPVDFTVDDVGDWIDEDPELVQKAIELTTAGNPDQEPEGEQGADPQQVPQGVA